jgi:hypothetical protein
VAYFQWEFCRTCSVSIYYLCPLRSPAYSACRDPRDAAVHVWRWWCGAAGVFLRDVLQHRRVRGTVIPAHCSLGQILSCHSHHSHRLQFPPGVCAWCAETCHVGHNLIDIGTRRSFQCDCGTHRCVAACSAAGTFQCDCGTCRGVSHAKPRMHN